MHGKRNVKTFLTTVLLPLVILAALLLPGCQSDTDDGVPSGANPSSSVAAVSSESDGSDEGSSASEEVLEASSEPTEESVFSEEPSEEPSPEESEEEHTHTYIEHLVSPTCQEKGYTEYTCEGCGDTYVADYTDTVGHDYGSWKTLTSATCTAEGKQQRACKVCGKTEESVIPTSGHSYTASINGTIASYRCTVCGDSFTTNFHGEHNFEPGTDSSHLRLLICKDCGYKFYDAFEHEEGRFSNQDKSSAMYTDVVKLKSPVYTGKLVNWPDNWHEYAAFARNAVMTYCNMRSEGEVWLFLSGDLDEDAFWKDYDAFLEAFTDAFGWTPSRPELCSGPGRYLEYSIEEQYKIYRSQIKNVSSSKRKAIVEDLVAYYVHKCGIYNGMQVYNAANRLYDYLSYRLVRYDFTMSYHDAFYGVTGGAVVCDGYATLFNLMCEYCGINSEVMTGKAFGEGHAWNKVTFSDGTERYVDATWGENGYYCLLPEHIFRQEHIW